jgi:hypothetical protein
VRYNKNAQRGINSLSINGEQLLLANCSVGSTDKNIWLYDLTSGIPVLTDSENLVLDTQRAQVFNFDAVLVAGKNATQFFSSTEEGLLWQGNVLSGHLAVTGIIRVAPQGGAIFFDYCPTKQLIAAAAYDIWLFKVH